MAKKNAIKADTTEPSTTMARVSEDSKSTPEGLAAVKLVASQFKSFINQQYQADVAYMPDENKVATVSVSKWLKMPEAVADAMGMPGVPFGCITQVYGKKDSGKTSFLMQAIAACQEQGVLPILVLSEFKFDFKRLSTFMGADPEAMIVFEADTLEDGFRFVEQILRSLVTGKLSFEEPNPAFDATKKESKTNEKTLTRVIDVSNTPCFLFWDSIGGTLSQSEAEGEVEDWSKDMGRGAQAIKKMVKRSVSLLNKVRDRVGILFLNQVWTQRGPNGISWDMPAGGEAVQHYYALEIHLKRGKEITMAHQKQEMAIGYNITMVIKKNHITHNRLESKLMAVAEGLISPDDIEDFKERYRGYLGDVA